MTADQDITGSHDRCQPLGVTYEWYFSRDKWWILLLVKFYFKGLFFYKLHMWSSELLSVFGCLHSLALWQSLQGHYKLTHTLAIICQSWRWVLDAGTSWKKEGELGWTRSWPLGEMLQGLDRSDAWATDTSCLMSHYPQPPRVQTDSLCYPRWDPNLAARLGGQISVMTQIMMNDKQKTKTSLKIPSEPEYRKAFPSFWSIIFNWIYWVGLWNAST